MQRPSVVAVLGALLLLLGAAPADASFAGRRQSVTSLSAPALAAYRANFTSVLKSGALREIGSDPTAAHGSPAFLPWHRQALHRLEDALQAPVHYWDFATTAVPSAFLDAQCPGQDGAGTLLEANPLHVADRRPHAPFPTEALADLECMAFAQLDFGLLAILLENLFESALAAVGGGCAQMDTAPLDPLYWAVVANVDRIWWRWSLHNPDASTRLPPEATRQLTSMRGPFSGRQACADTTRWDPEQDAGAHLRPPGTGTGTGTGAPTPTGAGTPVDGHVENAPINVTTGAHGAVGLKMSHGLARVGDSFTEGDMTARTHQTLAGANTGGNGSVPALAGVGMTFSSVQDAHTDDVPGAVLSADTGLTPGDGWGAGVPGKAGALNGWNGVAVPVTGNTQDLDGTIEGNGLPGPTATQTARRGGRAGAGATAPGVTLTTGDLGGTDGKKLMGIGHNVTSWSDVKPGRPGAPGMAVASVQFSLGTTYGWHNASTPPRVLSSTSALPGRKSSLSVGKGIQQFTMNGASTPAPTPAPTMPPAADDDEQRDACRVELYPEPIRQHMILSLCDVPCTDSPMRVDVVAVPPGAGAGADAAAYDQQQAEPVVIGQIFMEGRGHLSQVEFQRDRPCDISHGYKVALGDMPLHQLHEALAFQVWNQRTGKQVKTPPFSVRVDQYVF